MVGGEEQGVETTCDLTQLLDLIEERADSLISSSQDGLAIRDSERILGAVAELRGRGDTLVRRRDLRVLANWARVGASCSPEDSTPLDAAVDRIEADLGGAI